MPLADVTDWMDEFGKPGAIWYVKRLAANDTLATKSHQAGPYIAKEFLFELFPMLNKPEVLNPDTQLDLYIDSHADHRRVRAVWYNSKFHRKTRDETRLTRFGGIQSALLDPDNTGELVVFAFIKGNDEPWECHVWVCGGQGTEADLFEERFGPVEPKSHLIWKPGNIPSQSDLFVHQNTSSGNCWLNTDQIPVEWMNSFPSGLDIIRKTLELRPLSGAPADARLLKRRKCEFEVFRSIEEATWLPRIKGGFSSVDAFLGIANTILQSRKSRSGRSLEYHTVEIFQEDGMVAGTTFEHGPVIEKGKRPDFLFPSAKHYNDTDFPNTRLRMLAAKTTCKDRWRQILNEADRIPRKHLLTLQEGVSENQFAEMTDAGVTLVVPSGLHQSYPVSIRHNLLTLEEFIGDVRYLDK